MPVCPNRRTLLRATGAGVVAAVAGCAVTKPEAPIGRVVVVGGGYGGATAAKYLRLWEPRIEVTLVERRERFVSCPMSNLVVAGLASIDAITLGYEGLERHGVRRVRDDALAIDFERRRVRLARGDELPYDRLVLAPGIDFQFDKVPGLAAAIDSGRAVHAWQAGPQTLALRRQLEAMPAGGVFAILVPRAPYRCPPAPYERACLVAQFLKAAKPRAKLLVLDANPEPTSKKALFEAAWAELYPGIVEYRANSELVEFDARAGIAHLQLEDVAADVFNVVPPQQAGRIAQPLVTVNGQWVGVEYLSFESQRAPGVHVVGDAVFPAPAMAKSGFMANNQGKVVADAVIARLTGQPVNPAPILASTCYSFASSDEAMHVASVHHWDAQAGTLMPVHGAGGLSPARNAKEARLAHDWARNIWADTLG